MRPRRTIAAVVALALALIGIVFAPAAQAATTVTATITPTSVQPGQTVTYTLSVTGGSVDKPATLDVQVPAAFSTVGSPSDSFPTGWSASYTTATKTFHFVAPSNNSKLDNTQTITMTVQAQAPAASGSYTWTTTAATNINGNGSLPITSPIVNVANPAQAITFPALPDKTFGDADFLVSATGGGSGNPVTFSATGSCTSGGPNGATLHLSGAGSCSVNADQAAGGGYTAAPTVTRTFTITKAAQAITFPAIDTKTFNDAPFALSATSSAGLPVSYAATGNCSVSGGTVTITGAGSCTVTADQAGTANYNAAAQQSRTFTINKAGAVLSLADLTYGYDGAAHHATAATVPSGLSGVTVSYSRNGSPVADPTAAGSYDVTAELANANYAAEKVTGTLVINPRHITGDFTAAGKTYDGSVAADVLTRTLAGTVAGDDVHLTGGTATFDSKNAGDRVATLTGATLTGGAATNYVLDGVRTATATIGRADVTATIIAADKNYDGTDAAEITDKSLTGVLGSDDVGLTSGDAHFSQTGVGSGLTVSATISLTGADAANYRLTDTTASAKANIWAVRLTGAFTADNKTYDGTTAASTHPAALAHVVGSEDVHLVVSDATFDSSAAGDGRTVTGMLSLSGADIGNYELTSSTGTATADITPKALTGGITASDKVYDGTRAASAAAVPLTGVLGNDDVTLAVDGATFADKNVDTGKTVTGQLSLNGTDAGNYTVNPTATATAGITPLAVTGSITADDKVYDGTASATVHPSLSGAVPDDHVNLDASGSFADKNAGEGKTVTAGLSLSGDDAGNYTVNPTTTATASITKLAVTGSITADDKVYDGTALATVHPSLSDGIAGDDVTVGGYGSFADKNVGHDKTVTAQLDLSGADALNYTVNPTATALAAITPLAVTGTITADDKVYDGTPDATVHPSLSGQVTTDDVAPTAVGSFADKNVGQNKTVTAQLGLVGADAGNYTVNSTAEAHGSITAKDLTGTITADDKVYDGNTDATVHPHLAGTVGNDDVTPTAVGSFADKNAGQNKTVTAQLGLSGADAGNYTVNPTAEAHASITKLAVTGSITADDKVYDGFTNATVHTHLAGAIAHDEVTLGGYGSFADKNVGHDKTVTAQLDLSGADALNYTVNPTATALAAITPLAVTGTITADNKVYDGKTDATVHPSLSGQVTNDDVAPTAVGSFADKNAGTGKTVTAQLSLSGTDAGNYTVNPTATALAAITPLAVTGTITADNKVYDGKTDATVHPSLSGQVTNDDVAPTAVGSFADKNAGTGKTVTAQLALSGTDAGNYTVNPTTTATASITKLAVTGTITADDKVYDGFTNATVHTHLAGAVPTDDVTLGGYGSFADKNAGANKTVTAQLDLSGVDAGNYTVDPTTTAQASIAAKSLTGTVTADDKVYDGTANATVHPSLSGAIAGDDVAPTAVGSFADKNAGAGKNVTAQLGLSGTDAGNYTVNPTGSTTATITRRALTGTITADDKVYDGTAAATVHPSLSGAFAGDDVAPTAVGSFADKNAGAGKTVTAQLGLSGTDAGNYTVNPTGSTTATITRRALTGTVTADDKVYDGTAAATVHPHLAGNIAGDDIALGAFGSFLDKNAGTGKSVSAQLSLSGGDAGNYTVNDRASTQATITARSVTGWFTAADKVWDGTTAATINGRGLTNTVAGDDISLSGGSATFDTAAVGPGKLVTGSGFALAGIDAGNYALDSSQLTTHAAITPLYAGKGFYSPVDMTTSGGSLIWNTIKGGQTVPLKFEIFDARTGLEQSNLTAFGPDATTQAAAFKATPVTCGTAAAASDPVEVTTTGGTALRYDATAGQFIQNWKTPTTVGSCYAVTVRTVDGTAVGPAYFKITK